MMILSLSCQVRLVVWCMGVVGVITDRLWRSILDNNRTHILRTRIFRYHIVLSVNTNHPRDCFIHVITLWSTQ